MFDLPATIRGDLPDAFRRVWRALARPGTWWTAPERTAIAEVSREAWGGKDPEAPTALPDPAAEAAAVIGGRPADPREVWIEELVASGLTIEQYVEIVGVASRVTAVDTFHRAMGLPLEPFPAPEDGPANQTLPSPPARPCRAWVPMTGPASIPLSLSAVTDEMRGMEELHNAMYLSYEQMGDPDFTRGLHRTQMELVAARTSTINDCFF